MSSLVEKMGEVKIAIKVTDVFKKALDEGKIQENGIFEIPLPLKDLHPQALRSLLLLVAEEAEKEADLGGNLLYLAGSLRAQAEGIK